MDFTKQIKNKKTKKKQKLLFTKQEKCAKLKPSKLKGFSENI